METLIRTCPIQLSQPGQEALHSMRLVSKSCKDLAEPVLYRSMSLSAVDALFTHTVEKVQRFLDPGDSIRCHVRELCILGFKENEETFTVESLKRIIEGLYNLQSFRYVIQGYISMHKAGDYVSLTCSLLKSFQMACQRARP